MYLLFIWGGTKWFWIVPPQNHFVPPHINNRHIGCFMYQPWTYNMRIHMPIYVLCNMPFYLLMYLLYIFRQASMTSWQATSYVRVPVTQWTRRLTMNQKIAGSSPARIDRLLCVKDLDMLEWQADQLQLMSEVLWRNGQGVWLWIRRLQVRVLPGLIGFYVARI